MYSQLMSTLILTLNDEVSLWKLALVPRLPASAESDEEDKTVTEAKPGALCLFTCITHKEEGRK